MLGLGLAGVALWQLTQKPKPGALTCPTGYHLLNGVCVGDLPAPPAPPGPAPPPPAPPSGCRAYRVVRSGDTLSGIAREQLGNAVLYPRIYSANAALIEATARAHGLASSGAGHWIFPGERLCIPW